MARAARISRWAKELAAGVVVVAALALAPSAGAASFTEGDAEAVFNAGFSGGWAVRLHSFVIEAAPAQNNKRIFPTQSFIGSHVCGTDWHLINLNASDGGDSTFTHDQAVADMASLVFNYALDGAPLASSVTAIKRMLNPAVFGLGWTVAYWESGGVILPPDALSTGSHLVHLVIDNWFGPGLPLDEGDVTFYVDSAGTGACL